MKKNLLLILICVMILSLSSCSFNDVKEDKDEHWETVSDLIDEDGAGEKTENDSENNQRHTEENTTDASPGFNKIYETMKSLNDTLNDLDEVEIDDLIVPDP